jgi:LPPG:FO 2-phospho-L-lactate transferase
MMAELGLGVSASAVARRYGSLLAGFVLDHEDADRAAEITPRVTLAPTLMQTLEDRERLAHIVLRAAAELRRGK